MFEKIDNASWMAGQRTLESLQDSEAARLERELAAAYERQQPDSRQARVVDPAEAVHPTVDAESMADYLIKQSGGAFYEGNREWLIGNIRHFFEKVER